MLINCLLSLFALAPAQDVPDVAPMAFVNVSVVPMDSERVLELQTVVIEDGRISAMGATADVSLPEAAVVIDGSGKFLMPGLADMHVHNWNMDEHLVFLSYGVTTVRNLFGSPLQLMWRKGVEEGQRLAPTILTAGPIVDGEPAYWPGSREVVTAEDGTAAVGEQLAAGYDIIKVYNSLPADGYDAILVAAEEAGLPVDGHVPSAVGIEAVLEGPQRTIEHLDGFDVLVEGADSPFLGKTDFVSRMSAWAHADPERLLQAAELAADSDVWICPTEIVYEKWWAFDALEQELAKPHLRFVKPGTVQGWRDMGSNFRPELIAAARAGHTQRLTFTKALADAGAGLILGTDMGNPWVSAGFSLHEELDNFVEAGLTPYQALRAGTRSAAECLGQEREFGCVAVGLRADLLLLGANPLEDVDATQRPEGVMLRGRWIPRAELDRRLEELAAKYDEER